MASESVLCSSKISNSVQALLLEHLGFMRHLHQYSLTSPAVPTSNHPSSSFRLQKSFQKEQVPVLCSTGPPSNLYTALQFSFYSIIKQAMLASLTAVLECTTNHPREGFLVQEDTQPDLRSAEPCYHVLQSTLYP